MGNNSKICAVIMLVLRVVAVSMGIGDDYYDVTCSNVESMVKQQLIPIFLTDPTAAPSFLRLFFHDCQVQGCDASILLDSNDEYPCEMGSSKNFGIQKRETIGRIKSVIERECPGEVSCADIIALAARESVSFTGGPFIHIPLGRKDSTTCTHHQSATAHLPSPSITVTQLLDIFVAKGMNLEESVAILGAHTLGAGHCINVVERLYDPKPNDYIDYAFKNQLILTCPQIQTPFTNSTLLPNDMTPFTFDNQYYKDILMGRGLFAIDSSISRDPRMARIVNQFAASQKYFFDTFSSAFVKLSLTDILTEEEGEVRKHCSQAN